MKVIFIKKVISLIMIFLVGFTTHIKEEKTKAVEPFSLAKYQNDLKVAEEDCVTIKSQN